MNRLYIVLAILLIPAIYFILFFYYQYIATYSFLSPSIYPTSVKMFENTKVETLAYAVDKEDVNKIDKILKKNPEIVDGIEPNYGLNLLMWSIKNEKYNSAEALLKNGADPNFRNMKKGGETPLFVAACYSSRDNNFTDDDKYIKLLLKYGANPNLAHLGGDPSNSTFEKGFTPLMESIGCGISRTKALVDGGADINAKDINGQTASIKSLSLVASNASANRIMYAYYLIVDKQAHITDSYLVPDRYLLEMPKPKSVYFPVEDLRTWVFPLDSDQYKIKMEIVTEFKRQGVDYYKTPIPDDVLKEIKEKYLDYWKEYIKKY